MQFELEVLKAVASQREAGSASERVIAEAVDFYERVALSPAELRSALARLEGCGLVRRRGDRYVVTGAALAALPRTRGGGISMARGAWDWAGKRLLGAASADA